MSDNQDWKKRSTADDLNDDLLEVSPRDDKYLTLSSNEDIDAVSTDEILSPSDDVDDVTVTRNEIENTRASIGETLEAIKEKLDPQVLMDKAKDTVHSAVADARDNAKEAMTGAVTGAVDTVKGAGSSVIDLIKHNPMPAALIGLGGVWLYLLKRDQRAGTPYYGSSFGDTPLSADYAEGELYSDVKANSAGGMRGKFSGAGERLTEVAGTVREKAGHAAESVSEAVGTAREKVGAAAGHSVETARDLGESVYEMVRKNPIPAAVTGFGLTWLVMSQRSQMSPKAGLGQRYYDSEGNVRRLPSEGGYVEGQQGGAGEWVAEKAHSMKETAGEVCSTAWDSTSQAAANTTDTLRRSFFDNPIPIGLAVMGLGAALGLLLPQTERENRLMGETRDRLAETATEKVRDIREKVQRVAEETIDTAKEAAKDTARTEGLTAA